MVAIRGVLSLCMGRCSWRPHCLLFHFLSRAAVFVFLLVRLSAAELSVLCRLLHFSSHFVANLFYASK